MDYIPINKTLAEALELKLSKNKVYRSTDNFIDLYNAGIISVWDNEINRIAREIEDTYQNVELRNRRIIIKSHEEIAADKVMFVVGNLSTVARLQRIANDVVSDNYPLDTFIIFKETDKGVVYIVEDLDEIDDMIEYVGAERVTDANKALLSNPFLFNITYAVDKNMMGFRVEDLINTDVSVLNSVGNIVTKYIDSIFNGEE